MMLMTMQSKRLLYELDNALTLASFGRISLKLYPDCKPHNLKIAKAMLQHHSRRYLGPLYPIIKPFENITDYFFKAIK